MKACASILAICLLACSAAIAQPVMTQTGRALDANPGVGTGRANAAAPVYTPNSGQYLMTGQASLGQSFQGFLPPTNLGSGQFQGNNVGSAAFYNFERDAPNLQSVIQSGGNVVTMKNQPYVNNSLTVFGQSRVSAVSAAMAAGSSLNGSGSATVLNPFAQPQYAATATATARPNSIDIDRPLYSTVSLPDMPLSDQLSTRQRLLLLESSTLPPTLVDYQKSALDRQLEQALFIRPTATKPSGLPSALPEIGVNKVEPALKVQEGQPVQSNLPALEGQPGEAGTGKPGSPDNVTPLPGGKTDTGNEPGSSGKNGPPDRFTNLTGSRTNPSAADRTGRQAFGPSDLDLTSRNAVTLRPGQDLYSDLLQRANQIAKEQARSKPAGKAEPPAEAAGSLDRTGKRSALDKPAVPPTLTPQEKLDPTFGQFRELTAEDIGKAGRPKGTKVDLPAPAGPPLVNLQVTYSTYASSIPSRANRLLAEAEQLLWRGRFYDAIGDLAAAKVADPSNPLIWLRSCQAEVAAGEYVAAADDLQAAVRIFPSAATIRGPLPGLSGADGIVRLDTRLAELAALADQTHRTDLWMLLSYMRLATDRPDSAREAARQLVQLGSLNPQEKALVTLVLPPAPTSAPGE